MLYIKHITFFDLKCEIKQNLFLLLHYLVPQAAVPQTPTFTTYRK